MSFFDIFKKKLNPIEPHITKINGKYYEEYTEDDGYGGLIICRNGKYHAPDPECDELFEQKLQILKVYLEKFKKDFNPSNSELGTLAIVKRLFPNASKNICPYCGAIHDFNAKRSRKCPKCSQQMWVRGEKFLTDKQREKVDEWNARSSDYCMATHLMEEAVSQKETFYNYTGGFILLSRSFRRIRQFNHAWRFLATEHFYIKERRDEEFLAVEKEKFYHFVDESAIIKNKYKNAMQLLTTGLAACLTAYKLGLSNDPNLIWIINKMAKNMNEMSGLTGEDERRIISGAVELSQNKNKKHLKYIVALINQHVDKPIKI